MNNKGKSTLDPRAQKFIDALAGSTPIYKLPIKEARNVLLKAQAISVPLLPADIEDRTIAGGPQGPVNIRIVRPQGVTKMLPVVIYMHGGGWVLGNKETHDRLIREIAHGAQAAVVFVDYVPAPEAQYPSIHEEGYVTARWIAENGASLNLDTSRMAIAGDSVGGLMATAIALMTQEHGGPRFIFQVLFYPVTDAYFNTPSYEQFATGHYLEREGMKWFWDQYVPDTAIRDHPYASPLRASLEQLKKLPPALIITDENDVLRDEGEAYAHKLMAAGVPVVGVRYLGMIHDFVMLNALAQAPAVHAAIAQANQMLAQAFAKN